MDAPTTLPAGSARAAKTLPFPAQAGLFAVGLASLALAFGTIVPVVVWVALSVFWWGKPVGLTSMFLGALALAGAVVAVPAGGSKAPVAAKAPAAAAPLDPRRPPSEEGIWRYGIPKTSEVVAAKTDMSVVAAPTAAPVPTTAAPSTPSAPAPAPTATPRATSYKVVEVKEKGTIRGICRVVGAPEKLTTVEHFKDNDKGCGEKVQDTERVVVGEGKALGNCVVFLRSIKQGKDFPEALRSEDRTFLLDQRGCVYHPHVGAFRVATQVVIDNSDAADHNIHAFYETNADNQFNFGSAPGKRIGDQGAAYLEKSGKYPVKCDIHPWMSAYLLVFVHPYFDVTSEKAAPDKKPGEFVLADVPAGEYELVCWHEGMIETPQVMGDLIKAYTYSEDVVIVVKVTVASGGAPTIHDFEVPYK